jgi:hypothetical protein
MHHRLRMLMNEQDASPGGGAMPAPAPTTEPQAQGVAGLTMEDLQRVLGEFKNSVIADARRVSESIAGKKKGEPKAEPAERQAAPKASMPEDYAKLRARDRAFERSIRNVQLTDAQVERMERALELEQPDDVASWSAAYIADFGLGKQSSTGAPPPTSAAPPRSAHPVSDGGSPAPVTAPSDQQDPWRISDDDAKAIIRRDGLAVAGARWKQELYRSLSGRRVRIK